MKTIIVTGGGTAGHVMPIIALLPLLSPCKIHYIGSSGMEKELIKGLNLTYHEIASTKLVRSLTLKNLAIPFKLIKATREAKKIIDQIKPDLIFSKGGYVSLPVALASHKTPVILHESDKTLGLANKIALFKCDRLITSFGGFKSEKAICLGSPIRQSIYLGDKNKALNKCGLKKNGKPFLLILGGSLGSKRINLAVKQSLSALLGLFNIIHVVGKGNLDGQNHPDYYQTEFISDIHDYFALTDFALSRGGANCLFELIALKIPTLCIPLGKAQSRGDQIDNAKYFEKLGYLHYLLEEDLTPTTLITALNRLVKNSATLKNNMLGAVNIDGTHAIANLINSYL